jgi:hypothetical protein
MKRQTATGLLQITLRVGFALVLLLSGSASAASVNTKAREIERLLDAWQVDAAKQALDKLDVEAADHPRVIAARAQVAFHLGHYREAQSLLDELLAKQGSTKGPLARLAELYRSTAQTLSRHVERTSDDGHFTFLVPPGKEEILVPFAAQTLEETRARVERDLGYAPDTAVRVEILQSPEDLARVSTLTPEDIERSGTIALCKYNRLMIVSPRALLRGYGWRDTLAHEYTHLIVSRLSRNRVPIWLHEGIAKYFEGRWRLSTGQQVPLSPTQQHLLADALAHNKLIPWKRMHPSMAKLPDQRATALAFAQVQTAVELIARDSPGRLRRLIDEIRAGEDPWRAVRRVTGLSPRAFQRSWKKHLRRLGLRRLPGLEPQQRRFGAAPSTEKQVNALDKREARKFFRLADMLRRRRLTRAAVLEYEKAAARVGPRESFVANALARAYLELERPARAVRALEPVIEYYPELPGPQTTLGLAYLALDQREAANDHLQVSLRINPFSPELHCALAQALADSDDGRRHEKLCKRLGGRRD